MGNYWTGNRTRTAEVSVYKCIQMIVNRIMDSSLTSTLVKWSRKRFHSYNNLLIYVESIMYKIYMEV